MDASNLPYHILIEYYYRISSVWLFTAGDGDIMLYSSKKKGATLNLKGARQRASVIFREGTSTPSVSRELSKALLGREADDEIPAKLAPKKDR